MEPSRCAATTSSDPAPLICSRRNPLVRQLRQLHDGRARREQGLLLLEGTHLLQEVIRLGLVPRHLLATDPWMQSHQALLDALPPGCRLHRVSEEVLQAVATTQHPDGVVASLEPPVIASGAGGGLAEITHPEITHPEVTSPGVMKPVDFWLVLDTIQDPGNLGTLMRTALAAGVRSLWLADGADPHQPKVLRASAGAALALPLWRGSRAELAERLALLRDRHGVQLLATVPPEQGGRPYWQLDWTAPTALLLGSEGTGLARELQALASQRVTVPHSPAVESLNVAVAAAPLLLERLRQERMPAS
ncbi:MAG: RNA methyltransferase [Cyanobium sp. M30B3]|nr:MAG: RNA methyltransferase [Cyanobium sp. M30B3]